MALVAAGDFETDAALWARAVSVAAMIIISRTICFTVKSYYFTVLECVKVLLGFFVYLRVLWG